MDLYKTEHEMSEQEFVDSLPLLRRLDALVAKKIMGYTKISPPTYLTSAIDGILALHPDPNGGKCWGWHHLSNYSTNNGEAFKVVNRLKNMGFSFFILGSSDKIEVAFVKGELPLNLKDISKTDGYYNSDNLSESICYAALRAIGWKD